MTNPVVGKPYVSIARMGSCRICGVHQDLRVGVCFRCSDKVTGEKVSDTTHKMWERSNPTNVWYYSTTGH